MARAVSQGILTIRAKLRKAWIRRPRVAVVSAATYREHVAVRGGIARYKMDVSAGRPRYLLRRNIHRLEKGLTMLPLRTEFGVDYIDETVRAAVEACGAKPLVADAERSWIVGVLTRYFEQTASSQHATIVKARAEFLAGVAVPPADQVVVVPHRHAISAGSSGVDIESLWKLAENRRSVRWFRPESIERNIVDRAVRVASESPTACNRAPYRFEVFDNGPLVQRVAKAAMGTVGYSDQVPAIVVVIGRLSAFFHERDRHLIYIDSSLASMAFVFALEAQGVASCIINWPDIPERDEAIKEVVDLGDDEKVIFLIAYGYANEEGLVPLSTKSAVDDLRSYR